MTRGLAKLADLAYRRRGRMVLAWIAAAIVIIGVGSSLAGEYNADYNTPGSESKAASDLTEERFDGYSGQEIYVVWKDEAGARSPARQASAQRLLRRGGAGRPRRRAHADPRLRRRHDRLDHAAADGPRLGRREGGGREADRRRRGEQRRRARDQARRRPDLRGAGAVEPRGARLPRRRDRAADRLRLGGRGGPAARDRADRPRHHLRRPDPPARQRRRRARLDDGGVGPDRDRRRASTTRCSS